MNAASQSSLAELAVEIRVAQSVGTVDMAEMAWAAWVQAAFAGDRAIKLEVLAARIGLSEDATANVLAAERKHAERIAEAHELLKRLVPHEAEVRAILARVEAEAEKGVWRRLVAFVKRKGG